MALQIRRGTSAQRTSITPANGELIYTTDTKLVYVGDGSTAGGNIISGGGGITDIVSDTTPQLGGDLDVNGHTITSASNGDIVLQPNGNGEILLQTVRTKFIRETAPGNTSDMMLQISQHHNTADSNNFELRRSRGTETVPTVVNNGDDILDFIFTAYDGSAYQGSAVITCAVDGAVSSGRIPGKFNFVVHDGLVSGAAGLKSRLQILSSGLVKFDTIGELTAANGINVSSNLQLNGQNDLRFADSDSSNWVAFQAPSTVSANVTWTLPGIDGTAGQALTTNGAGILSWTTVGGGGGGSGLQVRTTQSGSTGNIADAATSNITITAYKTFALLKIQTSHASWVRLYVDSSSRTADASRAEGVDPSPGAGVIAEVITTGAQTILMSPAVLGFNNDGSGTNQVYAAIKNKSGSTNDITVTLTLLQLEN